MTLSFSPWSEPRAGSEQHLHFNGNQAGVERLVNIVVEKNLQVTFTDERINTQIELARSEKQLVLGATLALPAFQRQRKRIQTQ